jgi:hypothetical protein
MFSLSLCAVCIESGADMRDNVVRGDAVLYAAPGKINFMCAVAYIFVLPPVSQNVSVWAPLITSFSFRSEVIFPDIIYMQKLPLNIYIGKVIKMT